MPLGRGKESMGGKTDKESNNREEGGKRVTSITLR